MLECLDDRRVDVELLLVLCVAVSYESAAYEGVDIVGILQHAYAVYVQVACKVIEVNAARAFFHCNAKEHGLCRADAVALGQELYLTLCTLEGCCLELRIL